MQCQDRLSKGSSINARYKAIEKYLLSGLIYCGNCDALLVARRTGGRSKTPWASYECTNRRKTKTCSLKAVGKDFVENTVITELENTLFSDKGIKTMAKKIYEYAKRLSGSSDDRLKALEKQRTAVDRQIGNIVDSVADGFVHPSFKTKMDELELKKNSLQKDIFDEQVKQTTNSPSLKEIETNLQKNKGLKQKSLDEQKKVIQTYVRKVLVFDDTIDIKYIVDVDTTGGGGGNRTRVRKLSHRSIYECSSGFSVAPGPLQNKMSRRQLL